MRYWVEETYHLECSRAEVNRLFNSFPTWAGTSHVAESVGEAAMDAHNVVTAFMSLHDVGTWRVHDGRTHLTTSEDGEDVDNPYLDMTVHHGEKDLSALYATDAEPWFSHQGC